MEVECSHCIPELEYQCSKHRPENQYVGCLRTDQELVLTGFGIICKGCADSQGLRIFKI